MRTAPALYALFAFALMTVPSLAEVRLQNEVWSVEMELETLGIIVTPAGSERLTVSSGVEARAVSAVESDGARAAWSWDEGAYRIEMSLDGRDLSVSIAARDAGTLTFVSQPADAMGQGFILPRAEGYYVPQGDAVWRDFILDRFSPVNTSQDMSLPLLGMDRGAYTLSWIWKTPFNNTVTFVGDGDGLSAQFAHEFTTLEPTKTLQMILHLGDGDPLAGARRYKRLLIEEGRYESLAEKVGQPDMQGKVLGATQIYLWSNGPLGMEDVRDWSRFVSILQSGEGIAADITSRFQKETLAEMKRIGNRPNRYQQRVILGDFNTALNEIARQAWQIDEPDWDAIPDIYRNLRRAVAGTFGPALGEDMERWGGALSKAAFEELRASGLEKAWIGLGAGWEGGLWNPKAVQAGVDAGFLIAPYDSYQTSLPSGARPDWGTTTLGEYVFRNCGIVKADGTMKSGFQQNGVYTDPTCVRQTMESRITSIRAAVPFNSWFLDGNATGIVFDNYRDGKTLTQEQYARANEDAVRWITRTFGIPVGSEDGNAASSGGTVFGHGMQVPVLGWGDPDMQKNRKSPFYLGAWYPDQEPAVFFKSVPLKEPYRTVYFDPRTRLPLYQSVFHGSVVTSNHWLFDALKFTNVRIEMELTQLLYNVPPMFHLSENTLSERLPIMARQAAFFQPLHERLGTQEMTAFRYRPNDRLLQETEFEDGTRLVANFSSEAKVVDGIVLDAYTIVAIADGTEVSRYQARAD
ncbi:glycoside hydrolase [Nitratireductor luteus]|uniref:glycoside hydrolase n=1 Tax=Nitratireductor luteus TaxID=2976980 RepID=UPI00223ECE3B|nr:glycoside hydrolase [Nitratireductor luteus]